MTAALQSGYDCQTTPDSVTRVVIGLRGSRLTMSTARTAMAESISHDEPGNGTGVTIASICGSYPLSCTNADSC